MLKNHKSLIIVSLVSVLMLWEAFLMFEDKILFLFALCLGFILLGFAFDKNLALMKILIMTILMGSSVFYILNNPPRQYVPHIDAKVFFIGTEAVRKDQSPYVNFNVAPPPVFEFCRLLGFSLAEFNRNQALLSYAGALVCALVALCVILFWWFKQGLSVSAKIEFSLGIIFLSTMFFRPFYWNIHIGNFSIILAVIVLAIMGAHYLGMSVVEGLLLGAATSVKPYFISLAIGYFFYLLVKRDKKAFFVLLGYFSTLIIPLVIFQLIGGGLGFDTYREFLLVNSKTTVAGMLVLLGNMSCALRIISVLHAPYSAENLYLVSQVLSVIAFSVGLYLCWKNPEKRMSESEVAYFIFLTTAIFPLLWGHYYSWLFGPILFVFCKSFMTTRINYLVPTIVLCGFCLAFDSISWVSALAFPVIAVFTITPQDKEETEV